MESPANKLRSLLEDEKILLVPGCYDALSAKLIERAEFKAAFMSGFAVSGSLLALPDTGLISYAELVAQGQNICSAVSIPVCGDGDTGFGNAINVQRTVKGYARAGFASVMIEDQEHPKRCGHTRGKQVVSREEAFMRIQAAVDTRNTEDDILIIARTDARATHGLEEALVRCQRFAEIGADIIFLEAPETVEEMEIFCRETRGYPMANMLEGGRTPILSPEILQKIGYKLAAYPLVLMNASIQALQAALQQLNQGNMPDNCISFEEVRSVVGFEEYHQKEQQYKEIPK
ncbi:MAG: isocitrate lyase/PEP mutase family protein [SAR324 cluster bacterium]|nr:isocitrate lyase/PEP mutase family protein [SAR324 cluster bacterium]